jgi:aspartate aminotransferase
MASFHQTMTAKVQERLDLLYNAFVAMQQRGLAVRAIPPQGAIYLSVQFALHGRTPPTAGAAPLGSNEAIRRYLLDAAGMAVVPFQAFGMAEESGWMRLSVGAVSTTEIREMLPRVEAALAALR